MLMMLRLFVISSRDYTLTVFFVRAGFFLGALLSVLQLYLIALKKNLIFLKKILILACFAIFCVIRRHRILFNYEG